MPLPEVPRYPLRVRFTVLWHDLDALSHVNNLVYLLWFEEARIQYSQQSGLMGGSSGGVILAHQRIDYLAPVTYPDKVEARVSVIKLGTRSLTMAFSIWSEAQAKEVARGEGVCVGFDYAAGATIPLSDESKAAIEGYENGAG